MWLHLDKGVQAVLVLLCSCCVHLARTVDISLPFAGCQFHCLASAGTSGGNHRMDPQLVFFRCCLGTQLLVRHPFSGSSPAAKPVNAIIFVFTPEPPALNQAAM